MAPVDALYMRHLLECYRLCRMGRSVWCGAIALAATAATACAFKTPADVEFDADPRDAEPVDAIPPDAMPCVADTIVCDDASGHYTACGSNGAPVLELDCPLGCATDQEVCLDVDPSNDLAAYLDQARTGPLVGDVTFTGASSIDTTSGAVMNGGVSTAVPTALVNGLRVYMFDDLEVVGTLKVSGLYPLVLLANGDVTITGAVDVSADMSIAGPGAVVPPSACVGTTVELLGPQLGGGGGAGHHQAGRDGGDSANNTQGGAAGAIALIVTLEPLVAGCPGGHSGYVQSPTPPRRGGGGGGALQITARGQILLEGGGSIDASGGGGVGGDGGAGGGSGGSVLLEAPAIVLDGAGVVVSTKGGSGSCPLASASGRDGGTDAAAAPGGAFTAYAAGGAGGTAQASPLFGENGNSTHTNGGGSGGSAGDARFNTGGATLTPVNGASIHSPFTAGTIASRPMEL